MKDIILLQYYNNLLKNLSDDETIEKYAKQCKHCLQNTILPYEYEWSCISCGFNLIWRKHELTKIQRKKNFIDGLKCAEHKTFVLHRCI